jgi:acyl-CoA reductase-like NAD-dependent aldehyde dehydrogenase
VELPVLDAVAQDRPGAGRGLHRRREAGLADALFGLAWGVLARRPAFPKGVVNIVTGAAGEIGDELCANPLVKKITFTGSTEIGKLLMAQAPAR